MLLEANCLLCRQVWRHARRSASRSAAQPHVCLQAADALSTALAQSWRQDNRLAVDAAFVGLADVSSTENEASILEYQVRYASWLRTVVKSSRRVASYHASLSLMTSLYGKHLRRFPFRVPAGKQRHAE